MKKLSYLAPIFVAVVALVVIINSANSSPEKVVDIVKHWSIAWAKILGILVVVIGIIFYINKILKEQKTMSIVGMLIMPILIPAFLYLGFGLVWWILFVGFVAGLIIGYFSYIIDDHLLEAWRIRHIVLPIVFGLGFGGSTIVAALSENWQDEYIFVEEHATCNKLTIERYTMHVVRSGKTTTTTYSWDTYNTLFAFNRGETFAQFREGVDYQLGYGAMGKRDRIVHDYYKWIGGEKLNKGGKPLGFKWVYLSNIELRYTVSTVYEVEENYFGHAIKDGKPQKIKASDKSLEKHTLPTEDDVPGVFSLSFDFFRIMFTNPDFSLLRWIYLAIYAVFIAGAIFSAQWRIALFVFLISSMIIILIILLIVASKSGRDISELIPDFVSGGGEFGAAGASDRW